jgi:hypothetical protein
MEIKNNAFTICFLIVLTVFWYSLRVSWAVPTNYQAILDLKESEQQKPGVVFEVPQVEYTADNLRDPFEVEPIEEEDKVVSPPIASQPPLPSLNIQGIIWGSELPQAIINNQVVKIGDVVQGARIVDISQAGITVFYNGRQQLITAPAADMLQSQSP